MEKTRESLKRKLIFAFSIIIVLVFCSSALGWLIANDIESHDRITETIHLFKEQELQLRREEKNLLIRGYSTERFAQWQTTKENFHSTLGQLIGQKALLPDEIDQLKTINSQSSNTYKEFFSKLQSNALGEKEISYYDQQFKEVGRTSLRIIDNILAKEQAQTRAMNSRSQLLIGLFALVFIGTTSFLVINVLRNL